MYQVLFRFQGSGIWSPWFLPASVQAAAGLVRTLQKDEAVQVRVAASGAASGAPIGHHVDIVI